MEGKSQCTSVSALKKASWRQEGSSQQQQAQAHHAAHDGSGAATTKNKEFAFPWLLQQNGNILTVKIFAATVGSHGIPHTTPLPDHPSHIFVLSHAYIYMVSQHAQQRHLFGCKIRNPPKAQKARSDNTCCEGNNNFLIGNFLICKPYNKLTVN